MRSWITYVVQRRIWFVALTALVTLLLALPLRTLRVVIDPDDALPQTHPYIVANSEVERIFGNKLTAVIGMHTLQRSVLEPESLRKLGRIADRVSKLPGVVPGSVVSLASPQSDVYVANDGDVQKFSILSLAEKHPEMLPSVLGDYPAYEGLLLSADRKTAQIVAEFKKTPGGFAPIDSALRSAVESEKDSDTEFWISGVPTFLALLEKYSQRMAILFPLALLIIGLIHYEAFRTVQALILPLVTALLAVVWSLGILGLFRQPVDVFNASTPILILAIAAGHAVQILKRYYEEYAKLSVSESVLPPSERSRVAVIESLSAVGPVMVVACAVAALGFLSLVIFEIKSIRVFGVFTGVGVISALILELTFIPALRALLRPPGERELRREREDTIWDRLVDRLYGVVMRPRRLFWFGAGLAVLALVGATKVHVDNSQKSYFYGNIAERRDDDRLNATMAGTNTLYLLLDSGSAGGALNLRVLDGIDEIQRFLATQPYVGKSLSTLDGLETIRRLARRNGAPSETGTRENLLKQTLEVFSDSGQGVPGVDASSRYALVQIFLKNDQTEIVDDLAHRLEALAIRVMPKEVVVRVGGGTAGGVALNEVMIREKALNILQILGAVFLISALVFRSWVAGALIITPLLAALLANFGVMGWFGIPLQIATALVSAMAIGIGADYGIYMSYRIREELAKGDVDEATAFRKAFRSAGKATLFVSTAVAGGFGVLAFSFGFMVHLWMGALIAVAMVVSAMTALTVFPALLLSFRPRFVFGERSEPGVGRAAD